MNRALALCLLAGLGCSSAAMAQPVIDGSLNGDENFYGQILWVQNQPTGFGDNRPENVPDSGNPEEVVTGIEIAIPLSALGNPSPNAIRLSGWVTSGDHAFMSNQVLGGLPNVGNLGEPRNIDFSAIAQTQFVALNPQQSNRAPTLDGRLAGDENRYGPLQWVQNNWTGFGDAQHGNVDRGGGSELDGVYACVSGGVLYLLITGNLEANFNKLDLFFDSIQGGQNRLRGDNPDVDFGGLNRMGEEGNGNGLRFEDNFTADFYMTIGGGNIGDDQNPQYAIFANWAEILTKGGGAGRFLGQGGYGTDGTLSGGENPDNVLVTIDNSNVEGVIGQPAIDIPSRDFAVGSEINGIYGYLSDDSLYLLITGNLQSNYNKFNLFFDVQPGGQNALRGDNVDISFNRLNRMGDDGMGNALRFEDDFAADYWLDLNTGGTPIAQFMDAAVLRTEGPRRDFNNFPYDYGAFDGGDKSSPDYDVINFIGNNPADPTPGFDPDPQDGFSPNLYTSYGPRLAAESLNDDPFNPVGTPNLISGVIDNSNIEGVDENSTDGAAAVRTGVEIRIDLDELGWDRVSPIKVAGWIASDGYDFVSNQVLGGLPGPDNLGEVRNIDFSQIAGTQYVIIGKGGECPIDYDGNGFADGGDFLNYLSFFFSNDPRADLDGSGRIDGADFLEFLSLFFSPECAP